MYVVAYVIAALAVGLIVGYVKGAKDGNEEGKAWERAMQAERHKVRGLKAAETRRAKRNPLTPEEHLAHKFYDRPNQLPSVYAEGGTDAL